MIYKIFLLVILFLQVSCKQSAIVKKLKGCDSLVITFNEPGTDEIAREVSTTETKAIQKLARFLQGKETEMYKCGYDGNMQFFKAGRQVLPVVFKYSEDGCRAFVFDLDNKVMSTKMSNEAVSFLRSLAEGKNWY
mgnify:CR=1 FL=1